MTHDPRAYARRYYKKHKWRMRRNSRASKLKRFYGLTVECFAALLKQQRRRCAICSRRMLRPEVDHCHQSGRVRALLCGNCNRGLGLFSDDPTRLRAAAQYLSKHRE